jgi:hypothetical protein
MTQTLKIIYCLTSNGSDLYEAMTRVSLATVRLTNPCARIEIACDQRTYQALKDSDSYLLREADAVHGFITPDGSPTFRNRFVKTQLRLLMSGPFLFLDSDTVVRKSLDSLLDLKADIAASSNHSADTLAEQIWSGDQANLDTMGWKVSFPYVNGGVIWYADSQGARNLAEAWHNHWLENVEQTGRHRDQPALNYSLCMIKDAEFLLLNHCWNAQLGMNPGIAEAARVWHIYASTGLTMSDQFSHCCESLRSDRPLNAQFCLFNGQFKSIQRLVAASSPEIPAGSPILWRKRLEIKLRRHINKFAIFQ